MGHWLQSYFVSKMGYIIASYMRMTFIFDYPFLCKQVVKVPTGLPMVCTFLVITLGVLVSRSPDNWHVPPALGMHYFLSIFAYYGCACYIWRHIWVWASDHSWVWRSNIFCDHSWVAIVGYGEVIFFVL